MKTSKTRARHEWIIRDAKGRVTARKTFFVGVEEGEVVDEAGEKITEVIL